LTPSAFAFEPEAGGLTHNFLLFGEIPCQKLCGEIEAGGGSLPFAPFGLFLSRFWPLLGMASSKLKTTIKVLYQNQTRKSQRTSKKGS
jgi:hypothetical protein